LVIGKRNDEEKEKKLLVLLEA